MKECRGSLIGGQWQSLSGAMLEVENPATQETVARVATASEGDVTTALESAQNALPGWRRTPAVERARHLERIASVLSRSRERMAQTISREVGAPIAATRSVHTKIPELTLRVAAQCIRRSELEKRVGNSLVRREPVGVVAAITPWNYPLHQLAAKLAGALAAGCTMVLKPSELTPLHCLLLGEILLEVELPPGVINIVLGDGELGKRLCSSSLVDMVSFTGSTEVGVEVLASGAERIRPSTLELGGKSPCVVLESAPLRSAVEGCLESCFSNSGQTCAAQSRLLVPRRSLAEATELAVQVARAYRVGDPMDAETELGPLISEKQHDRVMRMVRRGVEEGARLLLDGSHLRESLRRGYYFGPTVFSDVLPEMTIAREEIFGPVLSIMAYDGPEHALRLANQTRYGLSAGVWGETEEATEFAKEIAAGQVLINGGSYNPFAPFGGWKQSGIGREYGELGIEEFQVVQSIDLPLGVSLAARATAPQVSRRRRENERD